jgi:hypothetical protein
LKKAESRGLSRSLHVPDYIAARFVPVDDAEDLALMFFVRHFLTVFGHYSQVEGRYLFVEGWSLS